MNAIGGAQVFHSIYLNLAYEVLGGYLSGRDSNNFIRTK